LERWGGGLRACKSTTNMEEVIEVGNRQLGRSRVARHVIRGCGAAAISTGAALIAVGVASASPMVHAVTHLSAASTGGTGTRGSGTSGSSGGSGSSGSSGVSGNSGTGPSGNSGATTTTVTPSSGGGVPTGAGTDRGPFHPGGGSSNEWWWLSSGAGLVLIGSAGVVGVRRRRAILP
jgi:hypothetical protein